jgi:hypothetical protein
MEKMMDNDLLVIQAIKNAHQKPLPEESVYKHVMMLSNYLKAAAESDRVEHRKTAKLAIARKLETLANSRAMRTLQDYCE